MAIDIYSTGTLNRVVENMKRPKSFLLDRFFTEVETSKTEEVFFDVDAYGEKRRLAPYVHPMVEGKVVEGPGYSTKSFRPAYVKDKRAHDVLKPFKRLAGEAIGTGQTLSPMQRREIALQRDLRDQLDMLTRRFEVQAMEALTKGTITVKMLRPDNTSETVTVNFQRDAALQITLGAGSRWGEAGVKPLNLLEDWATLVLQKSGSGVRNLIMGPDVWRVLRTDADFEKRLDLLRVQSGQINLGLLPENVQYKGTDGTFDYWVYTDWYFDGTNEVNMLDSGRVIGVGDIMGVRHFGAIKDEDAGFEAREFFSKSWKEEDPSRRFLLMQSAPLMVPYRINASFSAKVLA